jgi:hypothetical protein
MLLTGDPCPGTGRLAPRQGDRSVFFRRSKPWYAAKFLNHGYAENGLCLNAIRVGGLVYIRDE